jgi:hypothetical protein
VFLLRIFELCTLKLQIFLVSMSLLYSPFVILGLTEECRSSSL